MLRTKSCKSPCTACDGTGRGRKIWARHSATIDHLVCAECEGRRHGSECDCFGVCSHCGSTFLFYVPRLHGPAHVWCGSCQKLNALSDVEISYLSARYSIEAPARSESLATLDRAVADAAQRSRNWMRSLSRAHDETDGALCEPDASDPNVCAICRCSMGKAVTP